MTTFSGHYYGVRMKVTATEFKAKCLKVMDTVARTGEPVVITKHGREVARLVHAQPEPESLFGYMRGTVQFNGDVAAPIDEEWSALAGDEDHLYAASGTARASVRRPAKRKARKL